MPLRATSPLPPSKGGHAMPARSCLMLISSPEMDCVLAGFTRRATKTARHADAWRAAGQKENLDYCF